MFDYRKVHVCVFLAIAVLFLSGTTARGDSSVMSMNKIPGQVESKARRLTHDLKKQGFEVMRGYFKLWEKEDCQYTASKLGACYGNNPASPYPVMTVPPWPEEFVDPKTGNIWGESLEGYHDIYRFDPHEAIVILGQLPPPGAYFSEQTWVFTRQRDFNADSQTYNDIKNDFPSFLNFLFAYVPGHAPPPPPPTRIQALSSLSNPVNNVVIERQSGEAFDQIRYFIITPDKNMDTAVRAAFAGISVKEQDIFTEGIPSDMVVGLGQSSDDFTTWFRYAHPVDQGGGGTASSDWFNDLPMVVLRVRDTRPGREPIPYPPVVLETRTGVDEGSLGDDLGTLLYEVSKRWEQPCAKTDCTDRAETFWDLQLYPAYAVGPLCTVIGENCVLDNWDASYQVYGPKSYDNGEIYAVAGTLGTRTGNATYVGLAANQASIFNGVADIPNEKLDGTADGYSVYGVNNTDKFFLFYFTWDCAGLGGRTGDHCLSLKDYLPPNDRLALNIRNYLAKDSQRGPDSSLLLHSRVLQLKRP